MRLNNIVTLYLYFHVFISIVIPVYDYSVLYFKGKEYIMKKSLSIIIIISILSALIFSVNVSADGAEAKVEGVTYVEHGSYCVITKCDTSVSGTLTIPETVDFSGNSVPVTEIGSYAFKNCKSLESLELPDSLTTICSRAFDGSGLQRIRIPKNVNKIEDYAFADCVSLENIAVSDHNGQYSSDNGILYNKDKTILLAYPGNYLADYTVSSSVTEIASGAFAGCTGLRSVVIPGSVKKIGAYAFRDCGEITKITMMRGVETIGTYAFYSCKSLVTVIMPDTLTAIEDGAFAWCTGLKNAYYIGTTEQWSKVSVGKYNNEMTNKLIYHSSHVYDDNNDVYCNTCGYDRSYETTYTITFKYFDGQVMNSASYYYGDKVNVPSGPARAADNTYTYTFKDWGKTIPETCEGAAEYTAQYTKTYIDYTVTFKDHDDTQLSSKTYHYGDDVEVPQNLKRDADNTYTYTFKGWDKEVVTKCAGSAEYKAVYEGKYIDYTVVFKDHDGTELSSKTYHYGDKVEVPAEPTRKEDDKNTYKFKEWDKDVDPFCKGDAEYKAVYSATEKTVDPEGKDPEGKDPEGKDPEGKDPEGKDPEGKDPEETKPGKRIKGDMNGDNEANNLDLVFLFKYVSENEKSDDESVYDFYEDGEVNNKDVVSLFRYVSSI